MPRPDEYPYENESQAPAVEVENTTPGGEPETEEVEEESDDYTNVIGDETPT